MADDTRADMRTAELTSARERELAAARTRLIESTIERLRRENAALRRELERERGRL